MNPNCPDLLALLSADLAGAGPEIDHARSCAACGALLAEHRELGRALDRLRDPLPANDFVSTVMARVDAHVAMVRRTRFQIVAVFAAVLAVFAVAFALAGPSTIVAQAMTAVRDWSAATIVARTLIQVARPIISSLSLPLAIAELAAAALLALGIRRMMPSPMAATRS
jgi:hypothetical protein